MDVEEKEASSNNSNSNTTATATATATASKPKSSTIAYPEFNLESYISRYSGRVKVDRLLHIAYVCPDYKPQCYALAAAEVEQGIDVQLYDRVMETAQQLLGANAITFDAVWMAEQRQTNDKKVRYLEDEIQRWRNLSNRENICASYLAAAEYCVQIGNYSTAISRYIEAKSYAGDTKMLLDINLKIMKTSIQSGQFGHVKSEAAHALASEEVYKDNKFKSKVFCCLALYHLYNGRYDTAVQYFIDCNFGVYNKFSDILSGHDIAMYGGLCALASFNRKQLKRRVLDNTQFKRFLELTPAVSALVQGFYESEYGRVMSGLNSLKNDIVVDLYLNNRAEHLLTAIRGKALVQYFSPYSAMDIRKMAHSFNVPVDEMERELSTCIGDNHIKAKIDSHNKIVYAETLNKRARLFQNVLALGDDFNRDIKAVLLRTSLIRNRVLVAQDRDNMLFEMDDENGGGLMSAMSGMAKNFMGSGGGGGGQGQGRMQGQGSNRNRRRQGRGRGGGGGGGRAH